MAIRIVCAHCNAKMDVRDELAGSTRRCPKCKNEFTVPDPDDGVSLVEEDETPVPVVQATAAPPPTPAPRDNGQKDLATAPLVPGKAAAFGDAADDDDEDYLPSFMTAAEDPPERKTPAPPAPAGKSSPKPPAPTVLDLKLPGPKLPPPTKSLPAQDDADDDDGDDDDLMLSIPKVPPPTKPKYKPFDPDEFSDDPPENRSRTSRPTPSPPTRERPQRKPAVDDFDDDFGEPAPRTPRRSPASGGGGLSDPGTPAPSGTRDRAAAARELRQALKDSSLRGPQEPEKARGGFNFDLSALASELGTKGLLIIVGTVATCAGLYVASSSMMGGGPVLPKLGQVTGTITYDGTPVAGAMVNLQLIENLELQAGKKKGQVRTSIGITDAKGQFQMMYMKDIPGAAVGKSRVWIELRPPLVVPHDYSSNSVMTKDITAGSQTLDFALTSPGKR